ncbi:hypothetical protein Tco_0541190 [Tanacetum coccineum]
MGESISGYGYSYKKDPKIVNEDSWSDSDESAHEEMNKSCLMAFGSQEELELEFDETKRIKTIEVVEPCLSCEKLTHAVDSLKDDVLRLQDESLSDVPKIVIENPNHLNEPNKTIPKVNPVVPEPNQVVDIHDPNEMVDIPDDIDLVDYDKEDPEEEPKEDVEIELEDDAELIFPYEVEGDKTPPPRDVSSDSVSSDSESEDEEVDVAPEATVGTITQKPYAIRASSSCLMSYAIRLQVATWLKTTKEFTRGWVRLGCVNVDTQTT